MGELVASCNMHVTFFSQSAVVDMADVYSDSTITDEPLAQQTDEILNADDEDAHPSTDTVECR
jgi:hypothetical protein